jgi:organic hydroperoxide reductase OsmC/OhrA
VHVGSLECHAKAVLDHASTVIAFTSIHLDLRLRVLADDVERARQLVDDAKRQCFVANSVWCPVTVAAQITSS